MKAYGIKKSRTENSAIYEMWKYIIFSANMLMQVRTWNGVQDLYEKITYFPINLVFNAFYIIDVFCINRRRRNKPKIIAHYCLKKKCQDFDN